MASFAENAEQPLPENQTPEQRIEAYRQRYAKAATEAATAKRQAVNEQGLNDLRKQALGIIRGGGLNKKKIKDKLNPAVKQIEDALLPTLEEIEKVDPEISAERQAVLDIVGNKSELKWVERAVNNYVLCEGPRARDIIADNLKLRDRLSGIEADAIDICNQKRLLLGLSPMRVDMKLVACGRDHSQDMHEKKFFSHSSPVAGKKSFQRRANNFKTSASGENIAKGYTTGWALINAWWHSSGHLKNMMRSGANRVGVGTHKKLATMLVG